MPVAQLVKAIRDNWQMTQEEFAREIGMTVKTVSNYELGLQVPGPVALLKLIENAPRELATQLLEYLPEEVKKDQLRLYVHLDLLEQIGAIANATRQDVRDVLNTCIRVGLERLKTRSSTETAALVKISADAERKVYARTRKQGREEQRRRPAAGE